VRDERHRKRDKENAEHNKKAGVAGLLCPRGAALCPGGGRAAPAEDAHPGKEKAENERTQGLSSPRETLITFFRALNSGDGLRASRCLDLSDLPISARSNLGPVLAFKLKSVVDRATGRIALQKDFDRWNTLKKAIDVHESDRVYFH